MKEFSNFLNEILTLEYHDKLNPKLWSADGSLDPEVRSRLLKIAKLWQEFADIPEEAVRDYVFAGGNANFNYTDISDIDLHLIVDYTKIDMHPEGFERQFLMDKKALWAYSHNITIKGYPVELYAQPTTEIPPPGQGFFSLTSDTWIQEPRNLGLDFNDDPLIEKKADFIEYQINQMIESHADSAAFDKMKNAIRQMRSDAIAKNGEFGFGNLVFKELRNRGVLDRMSKHDVDSVDNVLSMN